ncbi:MAG: DUF177 domain-containing protein [Clostridia bacterium]|nr:DUF177 domain-containing protein [Clostridia bacterium]
MYWDVSSALIAPGTEFPLSVTVTPAPEQVFGELVRFGPAGLVGSYRCEDGVIFVNGTLSVMAYGNCANCLKPAEALLETEFSERFSQKAGPDDPEIFPLRGTRIDLNQMAQILASLALPMRFLCGEGCETTPDTSDR